MRYSVVRNVSSQELERFYEGSALTLEGLNPDSIEDYAEYLDKYAGLKEDSIFYIVSGNQMNNYYHLTGTNRYPIDLNIIVIELTCLNNVPSIMLKRFEFGGRWFDDVVDNNNSRELS